MGILLCERGVFWRCMNVVLVLQLVVAVTCTSPAAIVEAAARLHIVGEQEGWTLPPGSSGQLDYSSWGRQRTFHVGDTLVFQYQPDLHDVLQVAKDDYANCNLTAPLSSFYDGNTTISLNRSGVWYFVCDILDHCSLGQKVAVTCLDPIPNKHSPTTSSSKSPYSIPPPSTSIPYFSSTPPSPVLDPSPSTSNTPYFNPTPPTSNTPTSAPYPPPFVSPPPVILPIDPSSPSSWGPNNVPPPFGSPPNSSNPCEHQFPSPPPPLIASTSTPPFNLSPPIAASSFSPFAKCIPKALLGFLTLGTLMTLMADM